MLFNIYIFFSSQILLLQDGMQKEIFLKLVAKLERHCENVLIGNEIDYRRLIAQRSINKVREPKQILLLILILSRIHDLMKFFHDLILIIE